MRRDTSWRMLVAAFFLLMLAGSTAQAAINPATKQKLLAGDSSVGFGSSVSLSADGRTALIIAYDSAGYIFTRAEDGTWTQQAKLTAADGSAGDYFGDSVALSADGGTALIGAWGDGAAMNGSAYVFTRTVEGSWSQQAKLTEADYGSSSFGYSVSLSADGGTALIGSTSSDGNAENSGAAYIFIRTADGSWSQQVKLAAVDGEEFDRFGHAVSLSADSSAALISAPGEDSLYSAIGSAYVFARAANGTWSQQAKLTAADVAAGDWFGNSVSLSADGSTALVGSAGDDDKGEASGSVYVFTHASDGTWTQQAKLLGADISGLDFFGNSVSLATDGSTALIGAYYYDMFKGAAYVFTRSGSSWSQQAKLTGTGISASEFFGASVSLSADGGTALIGESGTSTAYVFDSSATPQVTSQGAAQAAINFLLRK